MPLQPPPLLDLYRVMLLARRLDERAWVLHRQGKIAFHISGIGQEAAQVGAAFALRRGKDWVAPYYRDLALMLALGLTPLEFVLGLMGKRGEPRSGGSADALALERCGAPKSLSHSSPVATQALARRRHRPGDQAARRRPVVLTTIGEGSTAQGEWYEAVNWAAMHKLPVIFLVENNVVRHLGAARTSRWPSSMWPRRPAAWACRASSVDGLDPVAVVSGSGRGGRAGAPR